ncbi:hypothetical protein GGF50DRAFT_122019, partial [Schizophyllum commune]
MSRAIIRSTRYGGEPFQYARDSAPSRYAYEPPEECEREPRPSTQVFGQDVIERALDFRHVQRASAFPDRRLAKRTTCSNVPLRPCRARIHSRYLHLYAYGEEAGAEDDFGGDQTIPRFHLPSHRLKASISVPNLRIAPTPPPLSTSPKPKWELPQGRVKWLSAEMWCNALLTPRPRLQLRSSTEKMGASLTGGKPGSAGKGSTSKLSVSEGSLAAGSIGKSTPKSSFAAGTEGD